MLEILQEASVEGRECSEHPACLFFPEVQMVAAWRLDFKGSGHLQGILVPLWEVWVQSSPWRGRNRGGWPAIGPLAQPAKAGFPPSLLSENILAKPENY